MTSSELRRAAVHVFCSAIIGGALGAQAPRSDSIPLPEHPRPDFQRAAWLNLNGRWQFAFDKRNTGRARRLA